MIKPKWLLIFRLLLLLSPFCFIIQPGLASENPQKNPNTADCEEQSSKIIPDAAAKSILLPDHFNLPIPEKPGIPNLGNTCFVNAALTFLRAIPDATTAIDSAAEKEGDPEGLVTSLKDILDTKKEESGRPLRTRINKFFRIYEQTIPDGVGKIQFF